MEDFLAAMHERGPLEVLSTDAHSPGRGSEERMHRDARGDRGAADDLPPGRVWLDDRPERDPPPDRGWTVVRTPEEAIALLERGGVAELSLDHDLGLWDEQGRERTGDDVVRWILEAVVTRCFTPPETIAVHSANPAGRRRMELGIEAIYRRYREDCR